MTKNYQEQLQKYEKLGAKSFQNFVFKLEKMKYKLIKKYSPHYVEKYEKRCDKLCEKALSCASSVEEKDAIEAYYRREKMLLRKELFQEKNRNYHINMKRPTEIVDYLKQNKQIHTNALCLDGVCFTIGAITTAISIFIASPVAIFGGIIATFSAACAYINFQCINLQNYNLCRLDAKKDQLIRIEERQKKREEQEYSEALSLIQKIEKKSSQVAHVPTANEIIANITTKEQAEQVRKILLAAKSEHEGKSINNKENVSTTLKTIRGGI